MRLLRPLTRNGFTLWTLVCCGSFRLHKFRLLVYVTILDGSVYVVFEES